MFNKPKRNVHDLFFELGCTLVYCVTKEIKLKNWLTGGINILTHTNLHLFFGLTTPMGGWLRVCIINFHSETVTLISQHSEVNSLNGTVGRRPHVNLRSKPPVPGHYWSGCTP